MTIGIVGYGVYIPIYRIKAKEIARVWGSDVERVERLVHEKAVAPPDEDSVTLAVEASREAIRMSGVNPKNIGAVYVGSESHPYAVKTTASIVAEAIDATPDLTAADLEFACKAGTAAIQMCMGLVSSNIIKYGLASGSDTAQGRPGDELEYTASAGAAAYIIGKKDVIANIEATYSYTTDTPDFWRREKEEYPRHAGRFTGKPAYFRHVISATEGLLEKTGLRINEIDYFVFHQPNEKFPLSAAKTLGIPKEKVLPGLMVPYIGNTYSASSLIGLAATLDVAKPGERIVVTSFGSGAGSDSFSIVVTDRIDKKRKKKEPLRKKIEMKQYVDYAIYAKWRRKIKR